jgi:hypothetical protein
MNYLTDRELLEDVINDVDLSRVSVHDVCRDYGITLVFDEYVDEVHRETGLKIVRGISTPKYDILTKLVSYLRKLYDEKYIITSLKRSIKRHGSL